VGVQSGLRFFDFTLVADRHTQLLDWRIAGIAICFSVVQEVEKDQMSLKFSGGKKNRKKVQVFFLRGTVN